MNMKKGEWVKNLRSWTGSFSVSITARKKKAHKHHRTALYTLCMHRDTLRQCFCNRWHMHLHGIHRENEAFFNIFQKQDVRLHQRLYERTSSIINTLQKHGTRTCSACAAIAFSPSSRWTRQDGAEEKKGGKNGGGFRLEWTLEKEKALFGHLHRFDYCVF